MPKFILIDNSIADTSGHHYQYAMYCLQAAKEMGYDPILATNKKFKEKNLPWKIFPVYAGTFWEHEDYNNFFIKLYNRFEKSKYKIPLSFLLRIFGSIIVRKSLDYNKIKKFSGNTINLFNKISLSKDDIIFLPTSGFVEILGILDHAKKYQNVTNPSWHFLFRRNIFIDSPEKYSYTYLKLRLYKIIFDKFFDNKRLRAFFYTDSDLLTEQYNLIKSVKFETLPIPHTIPCKEEQKINHALKITYLGDARSEKGFHHLPHIIQDLWPEYVRTGKVSFTIQSNYNIPEGETAAIVSRNQLQLFPSDKVKLLLKSPNLDEYQKILTDSNIVLLPYEKTNYFARSSGILVEALAFGIPVLVPSGTWLSRQFISQIYKHQYDFKNNLPVIDEYNDSSLIFRYSPTSTIDLTEQKIITLDWRNPQAQCWLWNHNSASFLLAVISFDKQNSTSAIELYVTQLTKNKLSIKENSYFLQIVKNLDFVTALIPLEKNTKKIWLGINAPYTETKALISNVQIYFLGMNNETQKIPLSSVGIIYDKPNEISHKLKEIVDNYQHYSRTAREFSKEIYDTNNAKSLVKMITKRAKNT